MKKDLLNKDCFGRSCPRMEINNKIFEVHECPFGKGFEIVHIDTWTYSQALIYDEYMTLIFVETPYFESKVHAIKFMLENAALLH